MPIDKNVCVAIAPELTFIYVGCISQLQSIAKLLP